MQLLRLSRSPQGGGPSPGLGELCVKGRGLTVRPLGSVRLKDVKAACEFLGVKTMSSAGAFRGQYKEYIILCTHIAYSWLANKVTDKMGQEIREPNKYRRSHPRYSEESKCSSEGGCLRMGPYMVPLPFNHNCPFFPSNMTSPSPALEGEGGKVGVTLEWLSGDVAVHLLWRQKVGSRG